MNKVTGALADYSLETPGGYQNVFHIRGIRNGSFSVRGRGCKSRILKIDNELPGEIKTSLNVIRYILTGDLVTGGSPDGQCGQSLWANGTSAFGTIMLAHTNWDLYGPVFNKVVDLTITKWEGGWNSNHGAVFQGCGSMCIKNFSVGDETNSVDLLTIKPASDGTPSFGIDILSGMSIGGKRGLVIESNNSNTAGINVHSFKTLKNSEVGVYLYNVHNSNINLHCAGDTVGLIVAGASHSLTGRVDIRGCAAQGLIIKPGLSNVVFSGVIERNAVKQAAPEVEVETEGYIDGSGYSNSDVRFGMLDVRSTTALSSGCYKLPTNNAIGIYQGFVSSINGLLMIAGAPNVARDIKGYATERSGHTDIAKDTVEIQVPHLLGAAPRTVQVTPTSSGWPAEWYVPHDKKTATSFTIRIPSGAPVQLSCDWRVSATAR